MQLRFVVCRDQKEQYPDSRIPGRVWEIPLDDRNGDSAVFFRAGGLQDGWRNGGRLLSTRMLYIAELARSHDGL